MNNHIERIRENEIIDFATKGNVIRFYLGTNGKQWGDDWNDKPYEHNAGRVYDEFVKGHQDIVVEFEKAVFTPDCGHINSPYSKEDMIKRKVPCVVIAGDEYWRFEEALANDASIKYYFGDLLANK